MIRRLAFLNLGFIDLLSCTSSLPPSTTSHQRILVCPRISKSWDSSERSWRVPNSCAADRHFGNRGCFKKSTKNKLVNRSSDKQNESVRDRCPPAYNGGAGKYSSQCLCAGIFSFFLGWRTLKLNLITGLRLNVSRLANWPWSRSATVWGRVWMHGWPPPAYQSSDN